MPRSTLDILSEFESGLTAKRFAGIEDYYASLSDTERNSELISDLARTELYLMNWPSKRLREILAFAKHEDQIGTAYASIVAGVYCDRVECGEKPSLSDFHDLELTNVRLQALRDPLGLGDVCGNYQVTGLIGAGGFGVVFEASSTTGERVAIKSSYRTKNEKTATLVNELLRAEGDAAKRLNGSFFPQFIDWIDNHNGHPCLVTELIDGHSLNDLIKAKALEADDAVKIVAEIALALYFAHCKRTIHRDVKPANVMIREDGRAVLLDFGFAVDDEQLISMEGQVAGTLGHQSPDAILGNLPDMDARSDVWALGPLLYECITGKSMFNPTEKEDALTDAIVAAILPTKSSGVPAEIQDIIQRCMHANPIARYDTALDVVHDLRKFLNPSYSLPPIDRTPLLAFRIGREMGEAQCHVDAFDYYMQSTSGIPEHRQYAVASLFMLSEEIRHCRILLSREPFNKAIWPEFNHDLVSVLYYKASRGSDYNLNDLTAAANTAMQWVDTTCDRIQEYLAGEPTSTQALFELGLVATLPKSIGKRDVTIQGLSQLAELPTKIWLPYAEFLEKPTRPKFVNDELRRFAKRVERHFLYPDDTSAVGSEAL